MNQFKSENIELYHNDCLEVLPSIPDKSIDLILCDLPYGATNNHWDIVIDMDKLWAEYKRVIKDNGVIALFGQIPFTYTIMQGGSNLLRYEYVWVKDSGSGFLNVNRAPLKQHENILVFYKKQPKYFPQMRQGFKPYKTTKGSPSSNYSNNVICATESNGERFPIDVVYYNRDKNRGRHPTQKPVDLLEFIIRTYTEEGDLVLDNCMGSGSTGVAARRIRRKFIGIEKDDKWYEYAKDRIDKTSEFLF